MNARDAAFVAALRQRVRGQVEEDEPLARLSTYRIGGPATVLYPASPEDVARALMLAGQERVGWFALGLGSNVLLPDEGMTALVIRLGKGLDQLTPLEGDRWRLGAGLPQPLAARKTAAAGFAGLHRFVGVPGTVGGGISMNAGCHGGDWSLVVEAVTVLASDGLESVLPRSAIPFGYRSSGLERRIVVEAVVRLSRAEPAAIEAEMGEFFRWREAGTPFNQPCCGSVFRNPAGPSWKQGDGPRTAGQLIEAAGWKGRRAGAVEVSPRHANYFVNTGGGTAAQVRSLIEQVRQSVGSRFGTTLELEVKIVRADGTLENSHA